MQQQNLVYSSVYIGEEKSLRLKVIISTGYIKKKYIYTDIEIGLFEFENVENAISEIQNKVVSIIKTRDKYDWNFYDINDMKYLTNVIIFSNDIKEVIFTNINETSIIDILKLLYGSYKKISFINLNGLDEHAILVDPKICKSVDNTECTIIADLYSENGNMEGYIEVVYKYNIDYLNNATMKLLIDDVLINASQRILTECKKKDIAVVHNNAYILEL